MPKISVVMGYYKRTQQLELTLRTVSLFPHQDTEIIIVDDNSHDGLMGVVAKFPGLDIKVLQFGDRPHINPCVVFNMGFEAATGELVVIQNPESLYLTDILQYTREHLTDENY